jgi:uncharacterized protein YjiS (DUF1127 family)
MTYCAAALTCALR